MIRALLFAVAFAAGLSLSPASSHDYPVEVTRIIDADTFDGEASVDFPNVIVEGRFRLYCINAPESRGRNKSPEGVAMSDAVKSLGIKRGRIEVVKKDAFGRWLVWFRPEGWDITLNAWLHRQGAPLYSRLTQAESAVCEARLP